FWNSGLSGACCGRPRGLLVSKRGAPSTERNHKPFQSGYFASSNACAADAIDSPAANATVPIKLRYRIVRPPVGQRGGRQRPARSVSPLLSLLSFSSGYGSRMGEIFALFRFCRKTATDQHTVWATRRDAL